MQSCMCQMRILKLFNMSRWFVILFFLISYISEVGAQLSAMEFTPNSAACNLTSSIGISVAPCAYDGTASLVIIATPEVQIVGANPISIANGEGTFEIHIDQGFSGTFEIGFQVETVTNDNGCNTYPGDSWAEEFAASCVCPDIDPIGDVIACESYVLPIITGTGLTGNQAYYDEPNGGGNMFDEGATITTSGTYYAYDGESGCEDEETFMITISLPVSPTFSFATTYCQGDTPDDLPTTSDEGITGTWDPSSISTSNAGTETYTFTPSGGECANEVMVDVEVNAPTDPTFSFATTYCQGDTPDDLPTTSDNGIAGTWDPSSISTSNAGTETYTFTPSGGECANEVMVDVVVNAPTEPTFSFVTTYCQGDTPDDLPMTSDNGITGTWDPSSISTATAGVITYMFTPGVGQCAAPVTIDVTVNPNPVLNSFAIQPSACGQMNGAIDISVSNCPGSCIYNWVGVGPNNFSSSEEDISGLAQGTYALTITNGDACIFDTLLTVPSQDGPQISAITGLMDGGQYCQDTMVELGVNVTGGSMPYSFLWDDGSQNSTRKLVLPTPVQGSENKSYAVTVSDATNCSDEKTISVDVFHKVAVNAGDDVSACVGKMVILTGDIGYGSDPNWSILSGQGNLDPTDPLNAIYSPGNQEVGEVLIRLSSGPNGACPGSSDSLIIAYSIPAKPMSSNTSFAICAGDTLILSVDQPPSGFKVIWRDTSQAIVGNAKDLSIGVPGDYTAHYYDATLDCEGPGLIFTVTQKTGLPAADITIELPANICSGDVELGVAFPSGSGNVEVEWSVDMMEQMGNPVQFNLSAGKKMGFVTVTDESGCPTKKDVLFSVLQTPLESDYAVDPDRELFCFEETATIIAKKSDYTYQLTNPTGNTSITDNGNGSWIWDPEGYVGQAIVELEVRNEANDMVCSSNFTPTITWRKELNPDFNIAGTAQVGKQVTVSLKTPLDLASEYAILYVIRPSSNIDTIPFNSDTVQYVFLESKLNMLQVVRGFIIDPMCEVDTKKSYTISGANDLVAGIQVGIFQNDVELCFSPNETICFSAANSTIGTDFGKYGTNANIIDSIYWLVTKNGSEIYNWKGKSGEAQASIHLLDTSHCIALEIGMYTINLELQQKQFDDSIEKSKATFSFSVIAPITEVNFKAKEISSQQEQVTSGPTDLLYLCPGQTYMINPDFTGIYSDTTSNNSFVFGGNTSSAPLQYTADKPGTSVDLFFTGKTAGGCLISDALRLIIRPQLDVFAADTLRVCNGDTLDVDIDSGYTSTIWSWDDGSMEAKDSTSIHLLLSESTTLSIQADSLGCSYSDSLHMQVVKVEGDVEAWPEPGCPNGLYRVVPGAGTVIDYLSPLPGLDTLNSYFFRVPLELLNDTVIIGLRSRELAGCQSEIRDVYPSDTNSSALGELFADLCTQTLLVPGDQCSGGEGTWYQIDKLSGAANEVLGAKENYLNQVSDDSLGQYTYVFVCSDSCAQVATTRSEGPHSPPCAPGEISWSFQLMPNPANTFCTLQLVSDAPGNYDLVLYDIAGRMMGNTSLNLPEGSNEVPIDASRWSSGMYIVVLSDEQGHRQMAKLIISR